MEEDSDEDTDEDSDEYTDEDTVEETVVAEIVQSMPTEEKKKLNEILTEEIQETTSSELYALQFKKALNNLLDLYPDDVHIKDAMADYNNRIMTNFFQGRTSIDTTDITKYIPQKKKEKLSELIMKEITDTTEKDIQKLKFGGALNKLAITYPEDDNIKNAITRYNDKILRRFIPGLIIS